MFLIADLASMLTLSGVILTVALGLGAVIFVHELGHFLVAKACGVKCEKFMIGFDIGGYKLSRKWGETVYGIGILPLGGYVKMLGQDDDPAHIADEMKRCQIAASSPDAVEVVGPKGECYSVDRRSYLAKSVPQRMAIISAGVVMNVIFALIFAVIAYGIGVSYMPCIVSDTVPGSPAWQAGIEPGDEIVKLGDRENPSFTQLRGGVTLGDLEQGIPCVVRRAADGEEVSVTLVPQQLTGLAKVGIAPPVSLVLSDEMPVLDGSPASRAKLLKPAADAETGFRGGDEIVRVGAVEVGDYRQLVAELAQHASEPLRVTVRRQAQQAKNSATAGNEKSRELTLEVPAQPLRRLGLVMKVGPITAIQPGSAAAEAGLRVGDVVTAVDGQSLESVAALGDWDPVTFPELMRIAAVNGQSVSLAILRPSQSSSTAEQLDVTVSPRVAKLFHSAIPKLAPMGVPALGIAYRIENEIIGMVPGSPAAAAKPMPQVGDTITAAKLIFPKDSSGETPKPLSIELGVDEPNWPAMFEQLQVSPAGTRMELTIVRGGAPRELTLRLTPADVGGLFVAERGFGFAPLERMRRANTLAEQVRYGWDETAEALTMVYRFLAKLGTQVPLTALGGPVTIATAAGYSAYEGLGKLLVFLTILSANLAVLNFLPIPLLDGGHMVFLAYEGVRGRPANEKFVVALHTIGFAFIVGLMLFVLALDVNLIPRDL